jgi:hypothetical protein
MLKEVARAATRVHAQGLRFGSAAWTGAQADYPLVDAAGNIVGTSKIRQVPEARAHKPKTRDPLVWHDRRVRLARQAAKQGYTMVTAEWHGQQKKYEFVDSEGETVWLTAAQIQSGEQAKLRALARTAAGVDPGYTLVAAKWYGGTRKYAWRTPDGEHIFESLDALRQRSCRIGMRVLDEQTSPSPLRGWPRFRWTLPDSSCIESTWPEFEAALRKVLGQPATEQPPKYMRTGFSASVRRELVEQVASQSAAPEDGKGGHFDADDQPGIGQSPGTLSAITLAVRLAMQPRKILKGVESNAQRIRQQTLTVARGPKARRYAWLHGHGKRGKGIAQQGR